MLPADSAVWRPPAAGFYRRTAFLRHDPRERLAKARRLGDAARAIRSGLCPERAGLAGLGVRPGDAEALGATRGSEARASEHRVDEGRRAGG